jgi:hypothetical protein
VRLTKLNPEFGLLYPEIPAGQWLPAWDATLHRANRLWKEVGPEAIVRDRLLPDEHFQFEGGEPRPPGWYVIPERLSDPAGVEVSQG